MTETSRNYFIILFLLFLSVLFSWPVLMNMGNWGIQDWDWFLLVDAVTRTSLVKFGQFPLWNPFFKGGMPLLAHPESNIFSPAFFVQLSLGELYAAKVNIFLHLFIGLFGMYCLARDFRLTRTASILSASLFMLSSMYALILTTGMEWGYGIAFMPWAFLFSLKARDDFPYVFAAVPVLCMIWLGGAVYPFIITLLLIGIYLLLAVCFGQRPLKQTITILYVIYGLTFALGAVKFFPAIEFIRQFPRHSDLYSGISFESLVYGLLGHDQTLAAIKGKSLAQGFVGGFSQGMDEHGMYVGFFALALVLIGLVSSAKKYRVLALCLVIFLLLSFGDRGGAFNLWALLKRVPPFSIMRSVERFRMVVLLCMAIFAGAGLQKMSEWFQQKFRNRRWPSFVGIFFTVVVLIDLFFVTVPVFKDAFQIPPIETPHSDSFLQIGGFPQYDKNGPETVQTEPLYRSLGAAYPAFLANAGTVSAYLSLPVPDNAAFIASPDYRGEVFLEGTPGTARYVSWSYNRLTVEVEPAGEGYLVINQNFYRDWHAKGNYKTLAYKGLLAVRVTKGKQLIELYYRPLSFIVGLIVSILTLGFMVWWFLYLRKNDNREPVQLNETV